MVQKKTLADFVAQSDLPLDKFVATEASRAIAGDIELLDELESSHHPAVSKLICGCENLLARYHETYNQVAPFYRDASVDSMFAVFRDGEKDSAYYIERIFPYATKEILCNFVSAYNRYDRTKKQNIDALSQEKENRQNNIQKTNERIAEQQKLTADLEALPEAGEDEKRQKIKKGLSTCKGQITKLEKELLELEERIAKREKQNQIYDELACRLNEAYSEAKKRLDCFDSFLSEARKAVFAAFDSNDPVAELVRQVEGEIVHPEKVQEQLKQFSFVQRLLESLNKVEYKERAVPVLAKLYENGLIDIEEDPFCSFLIEHPWKISDYVWDTFLSSQEGLENPEADSWLNLILDLAFPWNLSFPHTFDDLWCQDIPPDGWRKILKLLEENRPESFTDCLAFLILRAGGRSRRFLMSFAQDCVEDERIDSLGTLIHSFMDIHDPGDDAADIVDLLLQKEEGEIRRLRSNNERAQVMKQKLPADVYGAVSDALESLETLASNLDTPGERCDSSVIASAMKKYLVSLRKGLEVVGLKMVEDPALWKARQYVEFDPAKHSIAGISTPPQVVYLRTLGFAYTGPEGSRQIIPAKVGRREELSQRASNPSPKIPDTQPHHRKDGSR